MRARRSSRSTSRQGKDCHVPAACRARRGYALAVPHPNGRPANRPRRHQRSGRRIRATHRTHDLRRNRRADCAKRKSYRGRRPRIRPRRRRRSRYGAFGASTSVGIRGSSSQQVLVLMDGLPVAGSQIDDVDLEQIPVSGIDRIEVVEGGGSTLYGSGSIGGVINIITAPASARSRRRSRPDRSPSKRISFKRRILRSNTPMNQRLLGRKCAESRKCASRIDRPLRALRACDRRRRSHALRKYHRRSRRRARRAGLLLADERTGQRRP